ncbi:arp2/3 complex-activating protein rickA [Toxorhynchites rutilus septentrionalis]|uniref:arp2/3 complex-activating protein rickA n=1 Tax=Toxorhynchites rutilus septentrionalis TaxID=329112 RepID=UPI00247AFA12|nr:arp2/3 complex-activating protein rickA [Toxorhynchites rutilus septentrionalis]XP_055642038.1 arp2/3 complex-activating protein rickA [Toxorhynchites rutilus septentrionalis]
MDTSQQSIASARRSSIPVPKRKSSLHLYIANQLGSASSSGSSRSSSSSASSMYEEQLGVVSTPISSASPSRSGTAMSLPIVPRASSISNHPAECIINSSEYLSLRENHNRLINKCEEITKRNQNLESTNQILKRSVIALQSDIAALRKERTEFVEKNRKLKKKLSEIVHSGESNSDDDEDANKTLGAGEADPADSVVAAATTDDTADMPDSKDSGMDSLLNEMEKLKSYLNNVELQLYEANEKISELQESKQQFEETNEKLRAENTELSKIARLMSVNILESIDTSKRLENSYIQVRKERDHLVRQNRDSVDSKTDTNEEIQKMRSEMELKRKTFEAQFIEYKALMEQELSRNTNEQIVALQLEVDILKQDLAQALGRADRAEEEVCELRKRLQASQLLECQFPSQLDIDKLSVRDGDGDNDSLLSAVSATAPPPQPPVPPPPPPPPAFIPPPPPPPPPANATGSGGLGLSEAISTQKLNHVGITHVNSSRQQQATGLDSVIADIKSGRVTLRRRKPNTLSDLEKASGSNNSGTTTVTAAVEIGVAAPTTTSTVSGSTSRSSLQMYNQQVAKNPALREMYDILERMKRRNRKSKVIVESDLVPFEGGDFGPAMKSSEDEDGNVKKSTVSPTTATDGGRNRVRTVIHIDVDV